MITAEWSLPRTSVLRQHRILGPLQTSSVWLRRSLRDVLSTPFRMMLVPKAELVANPALATLVAPAVRRSFSRTASGECLLRLGPVHRRTSRSPSACVQAAELEQEGISSTGWATILEGMIRTGWAITATWPVRTEMGNRMIASGTNALASSIVLVLRPRHATAGQTTRRGFLAALKRELPAALERMREGAIAPVDLAQATIGPGMAVFSGFQRVVEATARTCPSRPP